MWDRIILFSKYNTPAEARVRSGASASRLTRPLNSGGRLERLPCISARSVPRTRVLPESLRVFDAKESTSFFSITPPVGAAFGSAEGSNLSFSHRAELFHAYIGVYAPFQRIPYGGLEPLLPTHVRLCSIYTGIYREFSYNGDSTIQLTS